VRRRRYHLRVRDPVSILHELRRRLDPAFRPDTASNGFPDTTPSSGHCAAVAAIVHELLGGEMVSTLVHGHSHWINRLDEGGHKIDVDLTGDQFGRDAIQIGPPGTLYSGLRIRREAELTAETLERARLLAERSGLTQVEHALANKLEARLRPELVVRDSRK
jgi:hypothetical protein